MFATATRTMTAAATALALAAATAAPAHAWGKNEQNFLKGVLAAVAVGAIIEHNRKSRAQAAPAPHYFVQPAPQPYPPRHVAPAPTYTPAAAAFAEYSPASKRAIQQRLRAYGYYRGAIDGAWGPGTRAAVEAYARDTGNLSALQSRDGTVRLLNGLLV
ncbi:MAG TPA: peptidoglycan-binding domain-containing protein [Paracoccaceae bacterium]|nr:peptidoglycan-binding domain-containing protein [Paracoccaceae bacterium]